MKNLMAFAHSVLLARDTAVADLDILLSIY